jgi:hypothetical protein
MVLDRSDVEQGHVEELRARVAVVLDGGIVDGEELKRLVIVDPHRNGIAFEQQADITKQ